MKTKVIYVFLILSFAWNANEINAETGFEPSLGIPAGYMDFSVNASVFHRIPIMNRASIEFRLHDSFTAKGDGKDGRLFSNTASSYILGRYIVATYIDDMTPFIAPGYGLHLIYSWANDGSPLRDKSKWTLLTKAHMFYGMDYELGPKSYFTFQGKITYPSDIVFDCWYFGFGFKL